VAEAASILRSKAEAKFAADSDLSAKVADGLQTAFVNLKRWWDGNVTPTSPEGFEEPFFEKPTTDTSHSDDVVENSTWDSRHLEYAFKVQMTSRINNVDEKSLVLDASEYKEDYLDWYSFTLEENSEQHHTSSPAAILLTPAHSYCSHNLLQ